MRYVISDLHIGHENIIEYCDRPFRDVDHMNGEIQRRWNETVNEDDTVLILGDFVYPDSEESPVEWMQWLNGKKLLVRGNHDSAIGQNFPANVVDACSVTHGRYQFACEHQPIHGFSGWQIHGHIHNNDMDTYPLVNYGRKTINVSAELLDYRPLRMDTLVSMLEDKKDYTDIN